MSNDLRAPRLLAFYERYLENRDTAGFLASVSQHYRVGTLQRLVQHDRREVRRGAVFALGFLGDFQDNHSLGCAAVGP